MCDRNHDELFGRQVELRYGQSNTETQLSLERVIKTRKNKRTKNSSCEPYAHFNSSKCHSATLERPEHFLARTRTLQCFTSKLGHRGRAPTSAANHKDVRGKSQRDRHPRCHATACLSDGLDELIRKTGFWTTFEFRSSPLPLQNVFFYHSRPI